MQRIELGTLTFLCDPEATRKAYAAVAESNPEECGCAFCLNYIAARPRTYAPPVGDILKRLGIDPVREAEAYVCGPVKTAWQYAGFVHFIGELVSRNPREAMGTLTSPSDSRMFDVVLMDKGQALVPEAFGESSVVQLEFSVMVPWVLEDPPPWP